MLCGSFIEVTCLKSCLVLFCSCVFSSFSIAITSLGEERANLSAFGTFVRFALVWVCFLCLGMAAACDCDTPRTFLLPFLTYSSKTLNHTVLKVAQLSIQLFYVLCLFYVLPCVILFLCFSVLLALRLPRLGKRELILVFFVRLFDLCLFRSVGFLFLLVSGKGCGLWLWHSLDFSLTVFDVIGRNPYLFIYLFIPLLIKLKNACLSLEQVSFILLYNPMNLSQLKACSWNEMFSFFFFFFFFYRISELMLPILIQRYE